ncbi:MULTISPECIES: AraC family transcriptional regulator [Butyrivibrio]|jgi:AraC-like DNA-binding protein|uniref:AraC family transcriptional regulator n=1 Tax=Butyrivibrio fibrisolvens TaxID=831 RepID=A0A317G2A9_BUTFI|nr:MULTISPECIES: AraC family transcriptional regulator [Butyrivibrio]PWT28028.1 AraC family transcriptional regulator [Butyrivibrio fibrisolvens]SEP93358.1 AraC-type DNA-binding protein [Butyrivibrio sp. TB]
MVLAAQKLNSGINIINKDFAGTRKLKQNQEIVQYLNDSTLRIWYNDQDEDYETHWHNAIEIIMPVEEWYEVTISEEKFHITPGEILIIPSSSLHSLHAPSKGARFIFLFDLHFLEKLSGFTSISTILGKPIVIKKETFLPVYDDIYDLLIQMRTEYFSDSDFADIMIYSHLLELFSLIGRYRISEMKLSNTRIYKQKEYIDKFNEVLEYIDEHYMENLCLESIAYKAGFSKFHFSRLFKQYTNFTFNEYLTHRRIKAASDLLAMPDLSITEVSLAVGFASISTFNRIFRQVNKCTPSEYRRKHNPLHRL